MPQNTIYIAEPIFSEKLQSYDADSSFPPIKKIGITTNHPDRREKELLGTTSPVKIAIVKAWTNVDARAVESMLHNILNNSRLDGEFFWDGNETLVDSVTEFMRSYHPEAQEITISDDSDVKAASNAAQKQQSQKIHSEIVPKLAELDIQCRVSQSGERVRFELGDYNLTVSAKTGDRYTFTIFSKSRSTEQALEDFPGSQEISAHGSDASDRRARIPMASFQTIVNALEQFTSTTPNQ